MITNSMGAKKVEGTDNWREIFDAHNDTADALEQMGQDVAPIVNGNKSVTGAASGEYVLVRNSSITGITDGAYKAAQAIPANTAIDSTYLTAITGGALNDLNSKISDKIEYAEIATSATKTFDNCKEGTLVYGRTAAANNGMLRLVVGPSAMMGVLNDGASTQLTMSNYTLTIKNTNNQSLCVAVLRK